jgi:hypothetical protein
VAAMKLNGWQRLGVVLSVVWCLLVLASGLDIEPSFVFGNTIGSWFPLPADAFYNNYHGGMAQPLEDWINHFGFFGFAKYGIGGVIVGWVVTYLAIYAYRWTKAGFKDAAKQNGEG